MILIVLGSTDRARELQRINKVPYIYFTGPEKTLVGRGPFSTIIVGTVLSKDMLEYLKMKLKAPDGEIIECY